MATDRLYSATGVEFDKLMVAKRCTFALVMWDVTVLLLLGLYISSLYQNSFRDRSLPEEPFPYLTFAEYPP